MAYAAGAMAAAMAQATKASGAIVNMEPDDFMTILGKCEKPLVIVSHGGFLDRSFRYLVGYKGLVFHTKTRTELMLPGRTEVVAAKSVWIPN